MWLPSMAISFLGSPHANLPEIRAKIKIKPSYLVVIASALGKKMKIISEKASRKKTKVKN